VRLLPTPNAMDAVQNGMGLTPEARARQCRSRGHKHPIEECTTTGSLAKDIQILLMSRGNEEEKGT